jgi:predicted GH43/DUF377 family glycosyl hydrolase
MPLVVTALYDLARLENEPRRRSVAEYLTFGKSLFSGNFDLHIFCDPELVDRCRELLSVRPDGVSTVIEALAFEELPAWKFGVEARLGLANGDIVRSSSTSNRVKDSDSATTLWWSKLGLIERVTKNSQYVNNKTFWWVDFGISHVSQSRLTEVFDVDQPRFCVLRSTEPIADDDQEFFQSGIPNVVGGIFALPCSQIVRLRERFDEQLSRVLDMGLLVNDESLLSWLCAATSCDCIVTTFDHSVKAISSAEAPTSRMTIPDELIFRSDSLIDISEFISRRIRLPDPERSDRRATNPSIVPHPDGGFFCLIRHVNYEYDHGVYRQLDGSDVIRTENYLYFLDDDYVTKWFSLIDDHNLCGHAEFFPVFGLEDARIVQREGGWWMSGTCREHRTDGRCQILMCKLEINTQHESRINFSIQLPFLSQLRHEKNWMPINGDAHEWVWGVQPTVRCRFDVVTNSLVPTRSAKGDLSIRGGSQVVPWRQGWLAVVHDVETSNVSRTYRHRFVRWDANWNLVQVSEPFRLGDDEFGLEFCAGLAVLGSEERLLLSVGIGDCRAELIELKIPTWL